MRITTIRYGLYHSVGMLLLSVDGCIPERDMLERQRVYNRMLTGSRYITILFLSNIRPCRVSDRMKKVPSLL